MIVLIDDHRKAYGVEPICRVLPIAPSPVQHRLVNIEIARGLRDTDTTSPNQSNRLDLELTSELATLHGAPPASPSHLNQVSVKPAAGH